MTVFAWPLQVAVFQALDTALSVPVYDAVPDNEPYPYVVIGNATQNEWDTDADIGYEITLQVHAWSDYRGMDELKTLQAAIHGALHRAELSVTGYNVITAEVEQSQSMLDGDGVTRHGVQQLRIFAQREE